MTLPGSLSPPEQLHISGIDFSSRELTFAWSSVTPDCPAIHYNILASNCGSCPTTTNHTNVTCTDVSTNTSVCTFAIQTVICGDITGNFSDPIGINTNILELYPTVTITGYIASTISLATVLIISIAALLMAMIIILTRNKAKSKAALDLQVTNRAGRGTHMESMYEDPIPSISTIHTQDNIAYGHTKTTTQT